MRMRIEPRIAGLYRLYRQLAAHLFPITPHITDAFHRMLAESKDAMKVYPTSRPTRARRRI